jgi:hypothetical protein
VSNQLTTLGLNLAELDYLALLEQKIGALDQALLALLEAIALAASRP